MRMRHLLVINIICSLGNTDFDFKGLRVKRRSYVTSTLAF